MESVYIVNLGMRVIEVDVTSRNSETVVDGRFKRGRVRLEQLPRVCNGYSKGIDRGRHRRSERQ